MKPEIKDVTIRQSPRPIGLNSGTSTPATAAIMLWDESSTRLNLRSKLCRNQTTIVAIRITENALCRKSFAFSHISWSVDRTLGRR